MTILRGDLSVFLRVFRYLSDTKIFRKETYKENVRHTPVQHTSSERFTTVRGS
jgi:hypothetical protein